ncbi:MAG TPA: HAMP domain-containing sensor histidine kinase [Niabella sp.]|nr:HAMP domain-containing sensor histidine kinase [Niabella sp.]
MRNKRYLKLYLNLKRWLGSIINIGVTTELSHEGTRRVRVINLIALLGAISSTVFFITNLYAGRQVLAYLNLATLASNYGLLYANYKKHYYFGQLLISIVLSLVFALSSLLYHNGMEFYLLIVTAMVLTVMKKGMAVKIISVVNCLLFILLFRYGDNYTFFEPFPKEQYFTNIFLWVIFYVIFFSYFRTLNTNYRAEIENRNKQLQLQQIKLLNQTQQLELSNKQLEILNSTKKKLFSIVAHDVRTPIAGLKTSLDLFNQNILSKDDFMQLSKELSMQLNQLHSSLENLLKWSNSQMSGIEIQKEKTSVEPLLAETLDLLQYNLLNKDIQVNIIGDGNAIIEADPNHIKLVMRNLISNAIKFSFAGSKIDVAIEKTGGFVHFSVTDNGVGMKEDAVNEIFTSVHIASSMGTSNEKGTGMGLKISKEFAEKNGGDIIASCTPGEGCKFTLTIPSAAIN